MSEDSGGRGPWMKRFFTVWSGQAVSLIGSALVQFSLVWWLTIETRDPIILLTATIVGVIPHILIVPFAGAMVDRMGRRRVMLAADGLTAAATAVLMLSFLTGAVEIWHVFAVLAARSALQGFHWPAMQASTSLMVPEEHLARIGGLNQSIQGLSSIIAPPMGAVLIATLPMGAILSVDIVTAAVAMLALIVVRVPEIRRAQDAPPTSILKDMGEAFRYLWTWKGALIVMVIFMAANLLITPAFTLLPLLTLEHFGKGALEYAAMESMAGAGMIAGGVLLGVWGGTKRKIVTSMAALTLMGIGVSVIGLLPPGGYLIAVVACLFVGFMLALVNGTVMAILQKGIRADLQGRVFALLGAIANAMIPAGLLLAAPVSVTLGIQPWFAVAGAVLLIIGGASFFAPAVMRLEDHVAEKVAVDH